jgi:Mrp family chromosome partitioning ATPase
MIENNMEQRRQAQRARRRGVVASSSLRLHFVALARQVKQWSETRPNAPTGRGIAIGVTALTKAAGKSTVSFNLACALTSLVRKRGLLIESDFGKHYVTRRLGYARAPGLSEMLLGVAGRHETVFPTALPELSIMGCGRKSDQEAVELPFEELDSMMGESLSDFGFLVFDLPLADHLTACHSILPHLDGIILVVESNQIDQVQIDRFRRHVESQGIAIVGVVLNKA